MAGSLCSKALKVGEMKHSTRNQLRAGQYAGSLPPSLLPLLHGAYMIENDSIESNEKKDKDRVDWLALSKYVGTITAALITPVAYIFGLIYHNAFLATFGIQPDHFPLSIKEGLSAAFWGGTYIVFPTAVSLLNHLGTVLLFLAAAFLGAALLVCTGPVIYLLYVHKNSSKTRKALKKPPVKAKSKAELAPALKRIVSIIGSAFRSALFAIWIVVVACLAYVVFALILASFLSLPERAGHERATNVIDEVKRKPCNDGIGPGLGRCLIIRDEQGKVLANGLYITRTNNSIAIFDGQKSVIYQLPKVYTLETSVPQSAPKPARSSEVSTAPK